MSDNNAPRDAITDNDYPGADLGSKLDKWDKRLDEHWGEWYDEAKICFEFAAGRQWTTDEVAQMENDQRIPVVIDRVGPIIEAICGAEIQNRQQVQYFPRQVGDTAIDDILTQGVEWIMDECDGDYEDSEAFRDALICGVGCTETHPDSNLESSLTKDRVDPGEMAWDPSARKSCFADARYLRRKRPMDIDQIKEMWPQAYAGGASVNEVGGRKPVIVDPKVRYTGVNGGDGTLHEDEQIVCEYQWYEEVPHYLVGGDLGRAMMQRLPDIPKARGWPLLSQDEHELLQQGMPGAPSVGVKVRQYWRCFRLGNEVLECKPIPENMFRYEAITGKRDRNKRSWYGVVRAMQDPAKWSNRFFSQILHILRTNSQGGVLVEEGAIDQDEFEDSWADPSAVTVVKNGAISGQKIKEKPTVQYPEGLDRLMQFAVTGIRDATGVNQEMLGAAEREQAGVLETQRIRQTYGILSAFFDSKRRYHRRQGKLVLKQIPLYVGPDKLVKVTGKDNNPQYVPLALNKDVQEYDVIVDEAPAGPNQKIVVWQMMVQLLPLLQQAGLPAQVWAEIIRWSPFPAKLADMMAQALIQQQEAAQPAQEQAQQLDTAHKTAVVRQTNAQADHHEAQAAALQADAVAKHTETARGMFAAISGPDAGEAAATAAKTQLDKAKTAEIMARIVASLEPKPEEEKEPA